MSGTNSSRNKALLAGAVAAGALLTGVGMLLYSHLEQKKKVKGMQQQLVRLDISLSKLYEEILALRNSNHLSRRKTSDCSSTVSLSSLSASNSESEYSTARESEPEKNDLSCEQVSYGSYWNSKSRKEKLFEEVDALMNGGDEERLKAFRMLEGYKIEMRNNVEFLWRFAKAHQLQASAYGARNKLEEKKKHVLEGLEYATKALSLTDMNADVHKWFAILTGMQADFVPVAQKIQNGFIFQKHILRAIGIKPNDYSLHHLLGRFKFELANVSWFEKKMAASLFQELPSATYKDAISDLLKAEDLNSKPWKENRLLLAKCYIESREYSLGVEWLNSASKVIPRTEEDAVHDREINLLLNKYKSY